MKNKNPFSGMSEHTFDLLVWLGFAFALALFALGTASLPANLVP